MKSQHGNALFLILIAVALFAALSYVITQSGRSGGGAIDREQSSLKAGQIAQHGATLRAAINRMILTGSVTPDSVSLQTDVSIAPCDTAPQTCVFSPSGGSMLDTPPPTGSGIYGGWPMGGLDGSIVGSWGYKDTTDTTLGYYIADVGTNTDVTGRDAFAYLRDITQTVCEQINKGLGISSTPTSGNVEYAGAGGLGDATYAGTENTFTNTSGAAFLCVKIVLVSDYYHYYHALVEH